VTGNVTECLLYGRMEWPDENAHYIKEFQGHTPNLDSVSGSSLIRTAWSVQRPSKEFVICHLPLVICHFAGAGQAINLGTAPGILDILFVCPVPNPPAALALCSGVNHWSCAFSAL